MTDLFQNVWGDKEEISVDHGVEVTLPVCIQLIEYHSSNLPAIRLLFSSSVQLVRCSAAQISYFGTYLIKVLVVGSRGRTTPSSPLATK
jgi:hypothetical protein